MTRFIKQGNVAVITGAAKGIGAALADYLASEGLKLALFDCDQAGLDKVANGLSTEVITIVGDITNDDDRKNLFDETMKQFDEVNLLINNAAIIDKVDVLDSLDKWQQILDVNLLSIVAMQELFVPKMLTNKRKSAVVNLGSKEGITTPPGNVGYSVSKAGVKVLTEHLQHYLRQEKEHKLSAHLFVPGYTWTPMNFPNETFEDFNTKPDAAWSPQELVIYFAQRLEQDDFYIICPDGEVTPELDAKRMRWAIEDLIQNRSALSRWDENYSKDFQNYLKE